MGSRTGYGDARAEEPVEHRKSLLRDYTETILVCVIFVIFSRSFVFQQSKIPSGSMMDTLLIGDYIMVNRFIYAPTTFDWERSILPSREIRRGDVVVFKQPHTPETDYIKRVIGLPGDHVALRDGVLHVNGVPVEEPYVEDEYRLRDPKRNWTIANMDPPLQTIPEDMYLVMGDHRNESADSREWGLVPEHLMKGRALLIWWSYDETRGPTNPSVGQVVKSWGGKIRHFFTKSRWERCFSLIR